MRIDPFVRKTMTNKNGVISAKFMVRSFNTFFPLAHRFIFFVTVSSFFFIRTFPLYPDPTNLPSPGRSFLLSVMYNFDQYLKMVIYLVYVILSHENLLWKFNFNSYLDRFWVRDQNKISTGIIWKVGFVINYSGSISWPFLFLFIGYIWRKNTYGCLNGWVVFSDPGRVWRVPVQGELPPTGAHPHLYS